MKVRGDWLQRKENKFGIINALCNAAGPTPTHSLNLAKAESGHFLNRWLKPTAMKQLLLIKPYIQYIFS